MEYFCKYLSIGGSANLSHGDKNSGEDGFITSIGLHSHGRPTNAEADNGRPMTLAAFHP